LDRSGDDAASEDVSRSAFFRCFADELDLRRRRESSPSPFLLFSSKSRQLALDLDFVSDLVSRDSFFLSGVSFLSRFLSGDRVLEDEACFSKTGELPWSEDWSLFNDRGGDFAGASSIGF